MRPTPRFSLVTPFTKHSSPRRKHILSWVQARYDLMWGNQVEVILGLNDDVPFNRSKARNDGVAKARAETLLIADGDTAFDFGAIERALVALDGSPWVIPYGKADYYNLTVEYSDIMLGREPDDAMESPVWDFKLLSWAGGLLVRKRDFYEIGGYDERFEGWGWEDVAFRLKLDHEIGTHTRVPGRALHLWHEREDATFGTPDELQNRRLFQEYKRQYNWRDERI